MELKQYIDKSWQIIYNGKQRGSITDQGEVWSLEINYSPFYLNKSEISKTELKQLITAMLELDAHEVYSDYKAKLRGFTIKY